MAKRTFKKTKKIEMSKKKKNSKIHQKDDPEVKKPTKTGIILVILEIIKNLRLTVDDLKDAADVVAQLFL